MVHIDTLHLQIPGLNEEEARRLGEDVAERLAERTPTHGAQLHLGALDLRLTAPPGASRSDLASLIAEAILKRFM